MVNFGQLTSGASEQPDVNEAEEAQFDALGRRINKQTVTYGRGPEPAMRETVEAQIDSIRQHVEDSFKLVKTEMSGQIDLLRRDINDLRDRQQQRETQRWDLRKILISGLFLTVAAMIGALITWLLTRGGP